MKITVLGCGASMGTPATGGFWGRCDPAEPRNTRTRASILIEEKDTRILVDAGPDLRWQLNQHGISNIDALLLTHAHADHINGLDDLRPIAYRHEKRIPVFCDQDTLNELYKRAPYLFHSEEFGVYTPFLDPQVIPRHGRFNAAGITVESFAQDHYVCTSLGFRFGSFAYSIDVVNLDESALQTLAGIETWIVDGGGYMKETPTTHANLKRVMAWVDRLKPKRAYLSVLSTHMDYQTLCDELPPHIRPAFDGLEIIPGSNQV